MRVDDLHMVYLRAQLAGDEEIMGDARRRLNAENTLDGIVPLVHESFVLVTRKWFGAGFTHGQVIRLVAQVRASLGDQSKLVDPVAAESEIRRALGENVPLFADTAVRTAAQMALLDFLVRDLNLDEAEIWGLLRDARDAAERTPSRAGTDPAERQP